MCNQLGRTSDIIGLQLKERDVSTTECEDLGAATSEFRVPRSRHHELRRVAPRAEDAAGADGGEAKPHGTAHGVRFLLYTCDFDVAGIVQVNSKYQKHGHSDKKWIEAQLDAYEQVLPNLRKHNRDYPDTAKLRSVVRVGNENIKDLYVAPPDMETKNTAGAQLIIDTLLDSDPRPVHVLSWGGANTTASALWKLKTEYPKEKFGCGVAPSP